MQVNTLKILGWKERTLFDIFKNERSTGNNKNNSRVIN